MNETIWICKKELPLGGTGQAVKPGDVVSATVVSDRKYDKRFKIEFKRS